MSDNLTITKRIVANTSMLYLRMALIMFANLYIVRLILDILGTTDYGIYSVVGGMVVMFTFLSDSMASATQRFFAYEIGKRNAYKLKSLFSISVFLYIFFSIIIVILSEIFGLWFIENMMSVPQERVIASKWVLQFTILTFVFNILKTPYHSIIIAYEKMKVFGIIGIIEVGLKFIAVYILTIIGFDKLIAYSALLSFNMLIIFFFFFLYARSMFQICRFNLKWNRKDGFEMLSYSGWNFIGTLSNVLRNHGINILLNVFFNPVVNAARGIAFQINMALQSFSNNFYLAVKPQITKSYSGGDMVYMEKLIIMSAKLAYFLILIISVPILYDTEYVLSLWLNKVPDFTVIFTKLIVINTLIDVINLPIVSAIQATGKIRIYQISVSVVLLLNLPISYIILKNGADPEATIFVSILLSAISFIPRLYIIKLLAVFSVAKFLKDVILSILLVSSAVTLVIILFLEFSFLNSLGFWINSFFIVSICILIIYTVGLSKLEKGYIKKTLRIK